MSDLFSEGSILSLLNTTSGAVSLAIAAIIILAFMIMLQLTRLNIFEFVLTFLNTLLKIFGKAINKKETAYHRDLEVGKINEKRTTVKVYRFLNDLTIDLGVKQRGASPYEFLFIVESLTLIVTLILCRSLFGNILMAFIMFPIASAAVICVLYTRANVSHDARIEAVYEAENIICNNIASGVVQAVRGSLMTMPSNVRGSFRDFLDNVEHKNYHIRTALMELNAQLGSVADDFIKKCIVFETEEEHGIAGMFQDIVEVNNIKMEMRTEMKRRFEDVKNQFIMGALLIFVFLFGVLAIYPDVRHFYLDLVIGQIILALDALLMVIEFVYITYLRAQEL